MLSSPIGLLWCLGPSEASGWRLGALALKGDFSFLGMGKPWRKRNQSIFQSIVSLSQRETCCISAADLKRSAYSRARIIKLDVSEFCKTFVVFNRSFVLSLEAFGLSPFVSFFTFQLPYQWILDGELNGRPDKHNHRTEEQCFWWIEIYNAVLVLLCNRAIIINFFIPNGALIRVNTVITKIKRYT